MKIFFYFWFHSFFKTNCSTAPYFILCNCVINKEVIHHLIDDTIHFASIILTSN